MEKFTPCIMEQPPGGGEWRLNAAGRSLARELAKGGDPLAARQSALLWQEVERLATKPAPTGKAGKKGGGHA